MGFELRERWSGQPLWARWVLAVYLIGFLEGSCVHILDVARDGIHAYASFPQVPLQVFFVSLAILDPLVAVLVGLVRREGVWLASAVMATDVFANWWGNRHWLQDDPARLVWLSPITFFGLFVVAFLLPLHRTVARTASSPQTAPAA
ncbi:MULTISPECIES: hypothetical protein [Streptomyces]|uniref:hypothetical protein n=1 Tax=Streptomyces TaxID=1883 RepID=UPI0007460B74|nr:MULTISPECIES: hypothetical protein [Streptomyces]KUN37238.1 hypothetical protein AQJ27_45990 [Streptomyces olivochromogenes]QIY76578.1 hypothetical protein HEP84_54955 [Streptomyces sp. RLB1-33]